MAEPYLPADVSELRPDHITAGYWEAAARRELAIQQCVKCKHFQHMPRPICSQCYSDDLTFTKVSGRGTIFSYTIAEHPVHPALAEKLPYNVILVDLDDAPGVRLVSNLVGAGNDAVKIGLPVEVVFEEPMPGTVIPRFKPAA